jgi:hypothetical protein
MSNEFMAKSAAAAAAFVVAAWPYLPSLPRRRREVDEAACVLAIARRLQAAGNKPGVAVCQQLLAVLLEVPK